MSHEQQSHTNSNTQAQSQGLGCALIVLAVFTVLVAGMLATVKTPILIAAPRPTTVAQIATNPPPTPTTAPPSQPTTVPSPIPPTVTLAQQAASPTPQTVADAGNTNVSTGGLDPVLIARGKLGFTLCAACHGPEGRGLPKLGKDLVESEFVHTKNDQELLAFVKTGRPSFDPANTTGIDMPPKGGNPALKDDDILAIITYVRSLSPKGAQAATSGGAAATPNPTTTPKPFGDYKLVFTPTPQAGAADSNPTTTPKPFGDYKPVFTPTPQAGAAAAQPTAPSQPSGGGADPALIARGKLGFTLCAACHGQDARGLPKLGKDLVTSEFIHTKNDQELLTFVKTGRPSFDPANTTGIDMPPKGGNPALKDDDILAIIAYVRSLSGGVK
jgi:disulfide bond formation protein DsbB